MKKSENYQLNLPEKSDAFDVEHANENMKKVDTLLKEQKEEYKNHSTDKNNPHGVTKTQIGLGNVPNVATDDQTPTHTAATTLTALASGEKLSTAFGKIAKAVSSLISHLADKNNPHGVTAKQVGLGNVPNVATDDQTPTHTAATTLTALVSGEKLSTAFGKIAKAISSLISHLADKNNPHGVTKTQIGLGNVENKSSATIRGELTGANITAALGYTPINITEKGATNGLAELDENGMVPSSQLPSYVDDVSEHASLSAFPAVGEGGKIYMALDTNKTYRWSGTTYVEISPSLALGETSSTAYRGDRGKTAYEHSQKTSGNPHGVTKADVGLGKVPNVATDDQTPTYTVATTLTALASGEKLSIAFGKIAKAVSTLISHISTSATASVLGHVKVDSALSTTSTNPVQNKIINSKIAYDVSGEELIEDFDYENWIVERAEGGGIEYPADTLERFERLIAQCVEASIKLNDSLTWKLKTSVTNKNSIPLDFTFNELKITTVLDTGATFTKTILSDEVAASNRWVYDGYDEAVVAWAFNKSVIYLSSAVIASTNKTDTATTYLYYR